MIQQTEVPVAGFMIDFNPRSENANASIRSNREPFSNGTDSRNEMHLRGRAAEGWLAVP
jgi:hypothetical protein